MLMFEDMGRLHYLRITPPVAVESVHAYREQIRSRAARPPIVCVDLRHASVIAPEAADQFLEALKNGKAERVAQVVSARVTQKMQSERLTRQAGRGEDVLRTFESPHEALEWLGELLAPAEKLHLKGLLDGTIAPSPLAHPESAI